jgi:hypothetical protein
MGVHEGEAFSAITKSIGSAPPALFVVLLFALVRCRFRLLLIGSSSCPICRDAASCQCRVAQAMEAAGISGYGTAGRAVRTSTSRPLQPRAIAVKVRATHHALLTRCGLNAVGAKDCL